MTALDWIVLLFAILGCAAVIGFAVYGIWRPSGDE